MAPLADHLNERSSELCPAKSNDDIDNLLYCWIEMTDSHMAFNIADRINSTAHRSDHRPDLNIFRNGQHFLRRRLQG
ncbi:hypothetical protein D3C84_978810 [compost metagenome]